MFRGVLPTCVETTLYTLLMMTTLHCFDIQATIIMFCRLANDNSNNYTGWREKGNHFRISDKIVTVNLEKIKDGNRFFT